MWTALFVSFTKVGLIASTFSDGPVAIFRIVPTGAPAGINLGSIFDRRLPPMIGIHEWSSDLPLLLFFSWSR